jgi:uncharacterized membrane protein YraQ (UPF0718 family)/copper chaperone CopZ
MMEIVIGFLKDFGISFWQLTMEMAPWLLLGFLFAGILKAWFPEHKVKRYLGRGNRYGVLNASIFGVPLPLCSCGVIPAGMSLYQNGAGKGATTSFMISTPQTGVDSIMATYSLLGLPFAIIRPIVALITGVIGGSVSNFFDRKEKRTQALEAESQTPERKGFSERIITVFRYGFIEMIQSIGKWLLIGLAFAALLAVVIPDDFFSGQAGRGITGMLLILAASVPLYVCATGSIPIAAVLMLKGVSPGAALVFLMAGPATNIATISVIAKQMGRKSLAIYLATIIGGAVLSGLLIDAFLPASWFLNPLADAGHHHESGNIIATIAGVIMLALILNAFILSLLSKRNKIPQMDKDQIIQIKVEGMTCMHCKAAVEKELSQVEGINSVEANHQSGVVSLDGKVDSWEKVEAVIRKAGYVFKGKM